MRNIVDTLTERVLAAVMAKLLGETPQPAPQAVSQPASEPAAPSYAPVFPAANEPTNEPEKRKRRYRGRVVYLPTALAMNIMNGKATKAQKATFVDEMKQSWSDTLNVVVNAGKATTAREIERIGKQKRKTVESSLTQLRRLGYVVSRPRKDANGK